MTFLTREWQYLNIKLLDTLYIYVSFSLFLLLNLLALKPISCINRVHSSKINMRRNPKVGINQSRKRKENGEHTVDFRGSTETESIDIARVSRGLFLAGSTQWNKGEKDKKENDERRRRGEGGAIVSSLTWQS